MNKLPYKQQVQIIRCLVDGCSMRATAQIAQVARNTVDKLLVELGAACSAYQDRTLRNLTCKRIQVDECWAFCYYKQKQVTTEIAKRQIVGDIWTWAAIDTDTKLVPCWRLGKRGANTASNFVSDLADRLADRVRLTSDGLKAYREAVMDTFGDAVDHAQPAKVFTLASEEEKQYSPAVLGDPDLKHIGTFIERRSLTTQMGNRRFTHLTDASSKKAENHVAAIALHMLHYNFSRVHQTLKTSPAIAAGVSDHVWTIEEIVNLLDSK